MAFDPLGILQVVEVVGYLLGILVVVVAYPLGIPQVAVVAFLVERLRDPVAVVFPSLVVVAQACRNAAASTGHLKATLLMSQHSLDAFRVYLHFRSPTAHLPYHIFLILRNLYLVSHLELHLFYFGGLV